MRSKRDRKVKVACYVVTYNRDDFITTCVASLLSERSVDLDIEVTVINNGSPDNTAGVLARLTPEDAHIITNEVNTPLALVLNDCLELGRGSGADYVLILNDDIEMRPSAIAEMVLVCNEVPDSIVTPLQINYRDPDRVDDAMLERLQATADLVNDAVYTRKIKSHYSQKTLIGSALLATPSTYAAIGDFDPNFTFYGLDDDYCSRARSMNISLLVAMNAQMLHMHGKLEVTPTASNDAWFSRWKTMYRARMLFILKEPSHPLVMNYLRVGMQVLSDVPRFLFKKFPQGSVVAARTLFDLIGSYKKIGRRREQEVLLLDAKKAQSEN